MSMKQCAWADNVLVVETDGYTRPCCLEPQKSGRIAPIDNGLIQAWNHPLLHELRENLKNGYSELTDPWCSRCSYAESTGSTSLREKTKSLGPPGVLKAVQFKLSNRCQLECAHCGPNCSSQHAKRLNQIPHVRQATMNLQPIIDDLIKLLPQLEYIKFTGGEPWMDPQHWQILEALAEHDTSHCTLNYITNGLATYKSHLWKGWKDVKIQISIDGIGRTYEWFRRNANWDQLYDQVLDLQSKYNTGIMYCITPWTVADYPLANQLWPDIITPIRVVRPYYMDIANMPNDRNIDAPFASIRNGTELDRMRLTAWAKTWDKKWKTPGQANEIFEWINA